MRQNQCAHKDIPAVSRKSTLRSILKIISVSVVITFSKMAFANSIQLGPFHFDAQKFGNDVQIVNGGPIHTGGWLNIANVEPEPTRHLIQTNFDTGIPNIQSGPPETHPVIIFNYSVGIRNELGSDFGVVVARYDPSDVYLSVSVDGVQFTTPELISSTEGIATGEIRNYFVHTGVSFPAELFVHEIDLDRFGVTTGAVIRSVKIAAGSSGLDLIRVAAFQTETTESQSAHKVPSPVWALLTFAILIIRSGYTNAA